MNNKFFILAVIIISGILISLLLFQTPKDIKKPSSWGITNIDQSFYYSWIINEISWDTLFLKTYKWDIEKLKIDKATSIKWIDWVDISINDIRKWFLIEIDWILNNNSKIIKKLKILKAENIIINSPQDNDELFSPIIIKWEARVFENTINYIITDSSWRTLGQWIGMTNSKSSTEFWDFTIKANYRKPKANTGSIEVFEISEKDGSVINSVKVDVRFWIKSKVNEL